MSTYSQIHIQVVFVVKKGQPLLSAEWEAELYKYITGIVPNKAQKMLAINDVPDHRYFLIGTKPTCALSDLVREIKKSSNTFINESGFCKNPFSWQVGFRAFSYSHSSLSNVIRYIENQKEHHRKKTFREEYVGFLKQYEVDYKEKYLLDWLEDL